MKRLNISLLVLSLALPVGFANADSMGRLNGYAKAPGSDKSALHLSDSVVVDESKKASSHGRLSGYAKNSHDTAGKRETIPVLAGMRDIKPVKDSVGYGRLDAYSDHDSAESQDFFQLLDTTNTAVWY